MFRLYRAIRFKFGLWLCIAIVGWLAITGGVYLGRFYLSMVRESNIPKSTKVNANKSRTVTAPRDEKVLLLNPIPVYYLQVGVYTDMQGAEEAARQLRDLGYYPYITQTAPFKLWLGAYQERADTEFVKQQLKDKGVSSFTASSVINGANLKYNKGSEPFIQGISPVLDKYTAWLKENLVIFATNSMEHLDWTKVNQQFTVLDQVYNNLLTASQDLNTNNPEINESLAALLDTVRGYQVELQNFRQQKDRQSFAVLQNSLLEFTDNYLLLWKKIDNANKT